MTTRKETAVLALALTDQADFAGREELMTDDVAWIVPGFEARGPAQATAFSRPMIAAFPDSHHQCDVVVEEGDTVVVEGVWTGTHTAPLATPAGEVPATGNSMRLPFSMVVHFDGDRAASIRVYFDQMTFLGQLGLIPQPA